MELRVKLGADASLDFEDSHVMSEVSELSGVERVGSESCACQGRLFNTRPAEPIKTSLRLMSWSIV